MFFKFFNKFYYDSEFIDKLKNMRDTYKFKESEYNDLSNKFNNLSVPYRKKVEYYKGKKDAIGDILKMILK